MYVTVRSQNYIQCQGSTGHSRLETKTRIYWVYLLLVLCVMYYLVMPKSDTFTSLFFETRQFLAACRREKKIGGKVENIIKNNLKIYMLFIHIYLFKGWYFFINRCVLAPPAGGTFQAT